MLLSCSSCNSLLLLLNLMLLLLLYGHVILLQLLQLLVSEPTVLRGSSRLLQLLWREQISLVLLGSL